MCLSLTPPLNACNASSYQQHTCGTKPTNMLASVVHCAQQPRRQHCSLCPQLQLPAVQAAAFTSRLCLWCRESELPLDCAVGGLQRLATWREPHSPRRAAGAGGSTDADIRQQGAPFLGCCHPLCVVQSCCSAEQPACSQPVGAWSPTSCVFPAGSYLPRTSSQSADLIRAVESQPECYKHAR